MIFLFMVVIGLFENKWFVCDVSERVLMKNEVFLLIKLLSELRILLVEDGLDN